jgi:isopentenyl phosphate kinase
VPEEVPKKRNVILKLGGSVVTHKGSEDFPLYPASILESGTRFVNLDAVKRICSEIKDSLQYLGYLVIVHGAGVFGHFPVSEFLKSDELKRISVGWPLTLYSVQFENLVLLNEMLSSGLPVISVSPRSMFTATARDRDRPWVGTDATFDSNIIRHLLPTYIPVLFGDLVFDKYGDPAVLSGDTILYLCARELKDVDLVASGTDVQGVFTDDPKKNPDAKLVGRIALSEKDKLVPKESSYRDVDGGMSRKFQELVSIAKLGVQSVVFDASKEGNVLRALRGEHVGTSIVP